MNVVSTGIEGFDALFEGHGLPIGSSSLVEGCPGTGKTTLGMQFIFNGATKFQEPGIIITFEEFPEQIYRDAAQFGWDLRALEKKNLLRVVGTSPDTFYDGLTEIDGLVNEVVTEIGAKRILVDSITLLNQLKEGSLDCRLAFNAVNNGIKRAGLTGVFTMEVSSSTELPFEEYVVDNVVRLNSAYVNGNRSSRYIEVTKSRGQAHFSGKHSFDITSSGVKVFPRARPRVSLDWSEVELDVSRVSTGVPGIDTMLGGGLIVDSATIVSGSTGVGKTMLGLQYLVDGAARGEKGLLFALEERPRDIIRFAESLNIDLKGYLAQDMIKIVHFPPINLDLDELVWSLRNLCQNNSFKRAVFDSISNLQSSVQNTDLLRDYIYILVDILKDQGITSLLTNETPNILGPFAITDQKVSFVVDTIILMRYVEAEGRIDKALSVLKMRGSDHAKDIRRYDISSKGIRIVEGFDNMEAIMTGVARSPGSAEISNESRAEI